MAIPGRLQLVSDRELVVGAMLGSMEAYDELVRRFRGAVLLVSAQTLGSWEAAEDVAQEAFLLSFKRLPQLHDPEKFAGWLCTIARNLARRIGKRDCRNQPTEASRLDRLILAHSQEMVSSPVEELIRAEAHDALWVLMAELPQEQQMVLLLYYVEQWPVARIADFLSLTLTTVKWRLHAARKSLRRRLTHFAEETTDVRE